MHGGGHLPSTRGRYARGLRRGVQDRWCHQGACRLWQPYVGPPRAGPGAQRPCAVRRHAPALGRMPLAVPGMTAIPSAWASCRLRPRRVRGCGCPTLKTRRNWCAPPAHGRSPRGVHPCPVHGLPAQAGRVPTILCGRRPAGRGYPRTLTGSTSTLRPRTSGSRATGGVTRRSSCGTSFRAHRCCRRGCLAGELAASW